VNERGIEGGGKADGLGKLGDSPDCDAVEGLAPPIVCRDVEPRNGARVIYELGGLFLEGQPMNEVGGTLLRGQVGIEIRGFRRILRPGA